MTTLVACSHGTRSAEGRATVSAIVDEVRRLLPDVDVAAAFVDVEEPAVDDVVAGVTGPVVVVPLLLSRGFHTKVDIARAVASHPQAAQTAPLGPHRLLAEVLLARLDEAVGRGGADAADPDAVGLRPGDHVVLAAAGSSDAAAVDDVEGMRELVQARLAAPVTVGYAAGASPRIGDAVAAARAAGAGRVVALSYVLAPGYFADVVASAGADVTTAPLGADPRIAQIVAERFAAARG